MTSNTTKKEWNKYCEHVLAELSTILKDTGYILDKDQPHIAGERFLTGPLAGGKKLVLIGHSANDGKKVVIKASNEKLGIKELLHERVCKDVLYRISFAYQILRSPKELAFIKQDDFTIVITEFIEQNLSFISRPIQEQFSFALATFKAQESAHATTYGHLALITKTFGEMNASAYCENANKYSQEILNLISDYEETYPELSATLERAVSALHDNRERLDQYGGFLTHWDFTPQNFRIRNGKLFLLDNSSLRFGNKYEGWARFINFMVLYNQKLASALIKYVRDNRTPEESESLKLMRLFRLVELIRYYASWLYRTEGDLYELTHTRIKFWTNVLSTVLDNKEVPTEIIEEYKNTRDKLRTDDEMHRQKDLH